MDAIPTDRASVTYLDQAPVLLTGSSDAAIDRARRTIEAYGARVAGLLPLSEAAERIELQGSASAIWIELDRDCGGPMDTLLEQVSRDVSDGRYGAVISTSAEILDAVMAQVSDLRIEVIVGADDAERAAALAIIAAQDELPKRVADVASDQNAARLRQLSDEVSRIAATLARLSTGPQAQLRRAEAAQAADVPEISAETVRAVIRARRLRARYFPEELFADPAWDMLLDLLQAELSHLRVPVSSLCIAAAVPATTALRWLKTMGQEKLFVRRADPHDGRRVFVELAPETSMALRRYFAELGPASVV
jgi:hypothetical protein